MMENIRFNKDGLVPAVIQDNRTQAVLMLAYMNKESLEKTLSTGYTWFYSRSRQKLWQKGETSGHVQLVKSMAYDCDGDTLLVQVEQTGPACHEGTYSCFTRFIGQWPEAGNSSNGSKSGIIEELYDVIADRRQHPKEGSYTNYLFDKGQDKILKKVGEESGETIIASKNNDTGEILYEMADLWYHCLVLLAWHGIKPGQLFQELAGRRK